MTSLLLQRYPIQPGDQPDQANAQLMDGRLTIFKFVTIAVYVSLVLVKLSTPYSTHLNCLHAQNTSDM